MDYPLRSRFGPYSIDVREGVLRRDGRPVPLTPKAFDVLAALVEQPGRLLTKEELLRTVWPDTFVEESNLAYNVFALRKALGDTAEHAQYIETVPRRGYRFAATVTPEPPAEVIPEPPPTVAPVAAGPIDTNQSEVPLRALATAPRWGLVALAPALAAVAWVAPSWRTTPPAVDPVAALPLTSLQGVVRSPSLSPDGNYGVFTWTGAGEGNPDVYLQQIGTGPQVRLTTDPGTDYSPSWSPDGRTIAFLRRGPAGGKSSVWRIAPLGGPERKVADIHVRMATYRPGSLAWCPDSSCVLVTDSPGIGQMDAVFRIAIDTGEKRQLTFPPALSLDNDPAMSPDGRSLVFRRDTTPFAGAFHRQPLTADLLPEGAPIRLTTTLSAGKPAWTPDGREILFGARGGLWRLDARRGGTPTRLPLVGQDGHTPVVTRTPDGRQRLAYVRSVADANVWRVDVSSPGAPASALPTRAISSTRSDAIANLSPDGGQLVFTSNRGGNLEVFVSSTDGSNAVPLTALGITPGFPRWSPDATRIVFHGDPDARPDVLVVPVRGGRPQVLTSTHPNAAFPSYSRDGRRIYFTVVQAGGEARIWTMPAHGGQAVQVTTSASAMAIEARDGRDLYYVEAVDRTSALWRMPLAGGPSVKLLEGVVLGNFDVVEGGIYYADRASGEAGGYFTDRPTGETRLRYFDVATGQSTTVVSNLGTVGFGLSASRDGRTVFFSRVDSSTDELMVADDWR